MSPGCYLPGGKISEVRGRWTGLDGGQGQRLHEADRQAGTICQVEGPTCVGQPGAAIEVEETAGVNQMAVPDREVQFTRSAGL